jgi:hypothetical protein
MAEVKIAYALVQSRNFVEANPTMLSSAHVREVVSNTRGNYIVSFEDNFFHSPPAVQVTALYNGWKGTDLNPINTPSVPPDSHHADRLPRAGLEWVTKDSCHVITSLDGTGINDQSLSFSITAIGN